MDRIRMVMVEPLVSIADFQHEWNEAARVLLTGRATFRGLDKGMFMGQRGALRSSKGPLY